MVANFLKGKMKMYKVYKLASIPFGVYFNGEYTLKKNKEYETTDSPFFDIKIAPADIELEKIEYEKLNGEEFKYSVEYLEHTAIYRKFLDKAIEYGVVLFHGSCIEYNGRAYIYLAPSGTGKSTHTNLIKQVYGSAINYINDDKPLIKVEGNECYVYGSPYNGKHNLSNNIKAPLGAICFLSRGKQNAIKRLDKSTSAIKLLSFTYRPKEENSSKLYFDVLESVITYPAYSLACDMSLDAPKLSLGTMSK